MRKILVAALCCVMGLATSGDVFGQSMETNGSSAFVKDFVKHWATAKELAVAVAQAMPEADYGFKPNPDEMSFGEQMVHITESSYFYCSFLQDQKSPFPEPVKGAKIDKATVVKQLGESFDYCGEAIGKLTEVDLDKKHGSENRIVLGRDVVLAAMTHMAHHRGQAEVYLRLKGIVPPKYKF
jgi:uncharacterized damage-inducible protein DinB